MLEDAEMRESSFTMAYGGPALADHRIDVRDLAPALLAMGALFDEANKTTNGDAAKVSLVVRAHKEGSFHVDLQIIQTLAKQLTNLLTGKPVEAAKNLQDLLFGPIVTGAATSLFALVRWLKGKRPEKVTKLEGDQVKIEVDNSSIVVNLAVYNLYENSRVQNAVADVVRPLGREGVDSFTVKADDRDIQTVTRSEAPFFRIHPAPVIPIDEQLVDDTHKGAVTLVSVVFREENKWRVYDGSHEFHAFVRDEAFLGKIDRGEISFTKGDVLISMIRTRQWRTGTVLHTENEIVEVIEHRKAKTQLPLVHDPEQRN